jgi:hypothetical protein
MTCWLRSFAHRCTNRESGAIGCLLQLCAESLQNDVLSDPGAVELLDFVDVQEMLRPPLVIHRHIGTCFGNPS